MSPSAPMIGKVRVICFQCNNPAILALQYDALRRFVVDGGDDDDDKDDVELDVVVDAASEQVRSDMCAPATQRFGADRVHWVPQNVHRLQQPSERNVASVTWAYRTIALPWLQARDGDGDVGRRAVLLLDGDCFPVAPVRLSEFVGDAHVVSRLQERMGRKYCWIGFVALASTCPHLDTITWGLVPPTTDASGKRITPHLDAGGETNWFLERNRDALVVRWIAEQLLQYGAYGGRFDDDIRLFVQKDSSSRPELYDGIFYHMRSVTCNWRGKETSYIAARIAAMRAAALGSTAAAEAAAEEQ